MLSSSKKLIASILCATLISGCTAFQYKENLERTQEQFTQMDEIETAAVYHKVEELKAPPVRVRALKEEKVIGWLKDPIEISANRLALSLVIEDILGDDLEAEYDFDINPNQQISFVYRGTKRGALAMAALQGDFDVVPSEDGVMVRKYLTETFPLPTVSGSSSFQIGSNSGGSGSDNSSSIGGEISATGAGDGQFSNHGAQSFNTTEHIYNGIRSIILEPGSTSDTIGLVEAIPALSSIVVRTTPSLMKDVKKFVDRSVEEMSKQVFLEIEVLEWQVAEGSEFGLDGLFAVDTGNGSVNVDLSAPGLSDLGNLGAGFVGAGKFDGTAMFLKALKSHNEVAVTTSQKVRASHQQMQEVDSSDLRQYISRTSTTYENDNANPAVEIEQDTVRDGVKMLVIPSVFDDHVQLKMNGVLSKFVYFDDQSIAGVTVRSPRTRQSRFNISGRYNYNEPVIVTQMKQVSDQSQTATYGEVLPSSMGERRVLNTLVTVTPRRAE
ncbi:hypothetical protein [Photobacterium lutimaris]|uniref:hypothetical protein n=1 Tax=Photobacterium lutimaris TaxID=388278 RepID=UPI00105EBC26|nr:hypothetical protein [Photobacterium lutimaris]TDR72534.1 hypothetical protein DFP78_11310 [Photobacterium lutimaris]